MLMGCHRVFKVRVQGSVRGAWPRVREHTGAGNSMVRCARVMLKHNLRDAAIGCINSPMRY